MLEYLTDYGQQLVHLNGTWQLTEGGLQLVVLLIAHPDTGDLMFCFVYSKVTDFLLHL